MWSVNVCMIRRQSAYRFTRGFCVHLPYAQNGFTPLMEAVQRQHKQMTVMLLKKGADPSIVDNVRVERCVCVRKIVGEVQYYIFLSCNDESVHDFVYIYRFML